MASVLVIGEVLTDALISNWGKNAIKLFKKWTVIGISIFLYLMYKIQQAIPKIKAPITANSICKSPNTKEDITIPM